MCKDGYAKSDYQKGINFFLDDDTDALNARLFELLPRAFDMMEEVSSGDSEIPWQIVTKIGRKAVLLEKDLPTGGDVERAAVMARREGWNKKVALFGNLSSLLFKL